MIKLFEEFVNIDKEIREKLNIEVNRPIIIRDYRHLNYDLLKTRGIITLVYPHTDYNGRKVLVKNDRKSGSMTRYIQMLDGFDFLIDTYGHDKKQDERVEIIILAPNNRFNVHENMPNLEISDYHIEQLSKGKRI